VPALGNQARFRLLLTFLCLALTSCDFGRDESKDNSPTQSEAAPEQVEIQSSLDGFSILPRRIAWTATTSLPPGEVRVVHFRLDGKGLWSDPTPPFAYGEEGAQLGTWMGPGRHRFTVRVIATDGSPANETVIVRVRKTKTNDKLRNVWGRLSKAEQETPTPPGKTPRLMALAYFADRIVSVGRSPGQAFAYEYWVKGHTLHLGTAWFSGAPGESARFAGWGAGGIQCPAGTWSARYTWSRRQGRVTGRFEGEDTYADNLILTAEEDPCAKRRRMLEGVWEGFGL
jgi:hypothetical protein